MQSRPLHANPISGDSLRHKVSWRDRTPADLSPGRYLLRLRLDQATVYAVSLPPGLE